MTHPPSADDAFDALFREHYAGLWRFVTRLVGAPDIAEEIVQDTLLTVWQRGEWKSERFTRGFLYVAARNAAYNYRRRQKLEERWVRERYLEWERSYDSAEIDAEYQDIAEIVRTAIDALPERCRLIYLMHREEELSYREIAEILQLSPKTVEVQIGRALKALRKALGDKIRGE